MLERLALRLTALAERYMPDAFVFALAATLLTVLAAFVVDPAVREEPQRVVLAWGNGFWELSKFTLQMSMIIIGGYVLASSPPIARLITWLAAKPRTGPGAIATVALAAMLTSLFNWGFSLIFSALFAKAVARRLQGVDYRALGAASFLGLGTVWAQGLSGSAALQMASVTSMPKALAETIGAIPLSETIFRWQSLVCVSVEVVVVTLVVYFAAPRIGQDARALGVDLGEEARPADPPAATPGERWERSPWMLQSVVALGFAYLALSISSRAATLVDGLNALDVNTLNLVLLLLGAALHRTPAAFMHAVKSATPAVWGVLLQFPFYAGISGIMTGTTLSHAMANLFVNASSAGAYPALVTIYSAVLGVFVPSGGSKWVIEAPYVLGAAKSLGVPAGWMVVTYDLGEAVANLVQPFWMLPILALLGLKARDVIGHTFLVAVILFPLILVLVTVLRP